MRKLFLCLIMLFLMGATAHGQVIPEIDMDIVNASANGDDLLSVFVTEENGRGCCSSHGGMVGCSGGRVKCKDGTLSPTCKC